MALGTVQSRAVPGDAAGDGDEHGVRWVGFCRVHFGCFRHPAVGGGKQGAARFCIGGLGPRGQAGLGTVASCRWEMMGL